jgi:hypothetical protein
MHCQHLEQGWLFGHVWRMHAYIAASDTVHSQNPWGTMSSPQAKGFCCNVYVCVRIRTRAGARVYMLNKGPGVPFDGGNVGGGTTVHMAQVHTQDCTG